MDLSSALNQPLFAYDAVTPIVALAISLAWFFMLGGCIGSFMNVVIYRVPAGLSIVHPGSHCPKCEHEIRAYDNIPIFGWLMLRGKCRDCSAPISARYPLVELLVALVFLVVAWTEPLTYGANLPPTNPNIVDAPNPLWVMFAGHLLLLCTLICAALIQFDGHIMPWKLFVPAFVGAIGVIVYWSMHRTLPLSLDENPQGWLAGLRFAALGMLAGVSFGLVAYFSTRGDGGGFTSYILSAAAIGTILGWQAVATIVSATTIVCFVALLLLIFLRGWPKTIRYVNRYICLAVVTGLYLVFWNQITTRVGFLGSEASWISLSVLVLATFLVLPMSYVFGLVFLAILKNGDVSKLNKLFESEIDREQE